MKKYKKFIFNEKAWQEAVMEMENKALGSSTPTSAIEEKETPEVTPHESVSPTSHDNNIYDIRDYIERATSDVDELSKKASRFETVEQDLRNALNEINSDTYDPYQSEDKTNNQSYDNVYPFPGPSYNDVISFDSFDPDAVVGRGR